MDKSTLIKIWIQPRDLQLVSERKKPSEFWVVKPTYNQGLIELTIPYTVVSEWQSNSKMLLKD